jgi:aminopeptidase N
MDAAFDYINQHFGQYAYQKYSFIQGGDGGMEYPMATLITGERSFGSLVGVSVHELMHSWYQMMLGSNESLYPWMDEGFTSYAANRVMNHLRSEGLIPGQVRDNPHRGSYAGYLNLARTSMEEPLSTHADHYTTNQAYGTGSYSKGAVFLHQLEYIIGKPAFDEGLLRCFNTWKMKHPNANDVIRVFEQVAGLELDWYREYWVNTTHTIDYGIEKVSKQGDGTLVTLQKIGVMPMPLDIQVNYLDGTVAYYTIPLRMMRGFKSAEDPAMDYTVAEDWPWTHPTYELYLDSPQATIQSIVIDPSGRMADIDVENNVVQVN